MMGGLFLVVNGGYRTGSTVAYNVVRELLDRIGLRHDSRLLGHPHKVEDRLDEYERGPGWRVYKSHVWVPSGARHVPGLRVIHTTRNPYDMAGSALRHTDRWLDVVCEVQRQATLAQYHRRAALLQVLRPPPLVLEYETYYRRPLERIRDIASHLGLDVPDQVIQDVHTATCIERAMDLQDGLSPGEQDDATLIQARHVGDERGRPGSGRRQLTDEQVQSVHDAIECLALDGRLG